MWDGVGSFVLAGFGDKRVAEEFARWVWQILTAVFANDPRRDAACWERVMSRRKILLVAKSKFSAGDETGQI